MGLVLGYQIDPNLTMSKALIFYYNLGIIVLFKILLSCLLLQFFSFDENVFQNSSSITVSSLLIGSIHLSHKVTEQDWPINLRIHAENIYIFLADIISSVFSWLWFKVFFIYICLLSFCNICFVFSFSDII